MGAIPEASQSRSIAPDRQPGMKRASWLSRRLGWTRSSYMMLSGFVAIIALIMVVWWPLVTQYVASYDPAYPFWRQMDWLLLGIFLVMSLLIMAGADLKTDVWIVLVGMAGGLAIETWGTQTHLWSYFTNERPPLWIIPAWPIASLSIDRLVRFLKRLPPVSPRAEKIIYWSIFLPFLVLLLAFVHPALGSPKTWLALLAVGLIVITPKDYRLAVLTFLAGSGLGYFLEVWGTTRACWTYYTFQTPPPFAVFAHGLAAVAFWRAGLIVDLYRARIGRWLSGLGWFKKVADPS